MRISDWSSDVCSSDLAEVRTGKLQGGPHVVALHGKRAIEQALGHFAIPIEQRVGAHFGQCSSVVRIAREIALEADAGFLPHPRLPVHARDTDGVALVVLAREPLVKNSMSFGFEPPGAE